MPARGGGRCGRSRSPRRSRARLLAALRVKRADEILQPLALEIEHALAERRQLVIAAPGIVELGRRAVTRFDDQSFLDETLQRTVQRGRPEPHLPVAPLQHVLHDAVAVLLRSHQGEQNVKPIAFERQERLRRPSRHTAIYILTNTHRSTDDRSRGTNSYGGDNSVIQMLPAISPWLNTILSGSDSARRSGQSFWRLQLIEPVHRHP